jgi:hypothetical protein
LGEALLHPLMIAAVALLLVNDHVLKARFPGLMTGKLSDAAGMLFFPAFLHALWQIVLARTGRDARPTTKSALVCALLTACVFSITKLSTLGGAAYAWSLGALQFPYHALVAALHGRHAGLGPVAHTVDPTDVVVVPLVFVAYLIVRQAPRRGSSVELDAKAPIEHRAEAVQEQHARACTCEDAHSVVDWHAETP